MIKRGQVLFLLVSVFVVVAAWVGFSIYHTYVTSTISQDLQTAITPISPGFDTGALDKLKTRKGVVPLYQLQPSAVPTQVSSPTPATQAAQVTGALSPTPPPSSGSATLHGV